MKREFLQSFQVGEAPLPKEIVDAIMAENGKDIQAARQASAQWEEKYNQAVEDHGRELSALRLQSALEHAVLKAGGRNTKAIAALLDLQTLEKSQDLTASLEEAVGVLKQENGYLFEEKQIPPPYARGTGARETAPITKPATLAGALREKYERK